MKNLVLVVALGSTVAALPGCKADESPCLGDANCASFQCEGDAHCECKGKDPAQSCGITLGFDPSIAATPPTTPQFPLDDAKAMIVQVTYQEPCGPQVYTSPCTPRSAGFSVMELYSAQALTCPDATGDSGVDVDVLLFTDPDCRTRTASCHAESVTCCPGGTKAGYLPCQAD